MWISVPCSTLSQGLTSNIQCKAQRIFCFRVIDLTIVYVETSTAVVTHDCTHGTTSAKGICSHIHHRTTSSEVPLMRRSSERIHRIRSFHYYLAAGDDAFTSTVVILNVDLSLIFLHFIHHHSIIASSHRPKLLRCISHVYLPLSPSYSPRSQVLLLRPKQGRNVVRMSSR